jgi:hypothetical protein
MQKFQDFYFEKFDFDEKTLKANFYFSFDKKEFFKEEIDFFCANFILINQIDKQVLNNLLFNTCLSLWISYYKLFPTKNLFVESWYLDDFQIEFWQKFYRNWLWEFFIKNSINPNWLIKFQNTKEKNKSDIKLIKQKCNKSLLLLWWWKDSIVSYSLIKNSEFDLFVFWKNDEIKKNCAKIIWKEILLVKRTLSENLIKLNEQNWFYNGHVPITWIIAFISVFVSYIYWYKYIILSNEKSSSEENTIWNGLKINHQYSKSLEFEIDFSNYLDKYISKDIKYFSLLRWMYEYKIAEIFSKQKEFFSNFSSCNKNFKISKVENKNTLWCCDCEKCVFVFLILFNFVWEKDIVNIFWKNLFLDEKLQDTFSELAWLSNHKPFECVWTYEESLFSLYKSIKYYHDLWKDLPIILYNLERKVYKKIKWIEIKKIEQKLLKIYDDDIIPSEIKNKFFNI